VRCRAPEPVLRRRIDGRLAEGRDASEATQRVLDWQLAHVEGIDDSEDLRVIDADTTRPGIVAEIATLLS
jgi:predicted kinase